MLVHVTRLFLQQHSKVSVPPKMPSNKMMEQHAPGHYGMYNNVINTPNTTLIIYTEMK